MKNRNNTYQISDQISLINSNQRTNKEVTKTSYDRFRTITSSAIYSKSTDAKPTESPCSIWSNDQAYESSIEDELSGSELKTFSFRCIETLANLANFDKGQTIPQALENLIKEDFASLITLIKEYKVAKHEFNENKTWTKKFVSSIQPLIEANSGPAREIAQLTDQAVKCVERSLCSKYTVQTLKSRINTIIESAPKFVKDTGKELHLPEPVMDKIAKHVRQAFLTIAK